MCEERTGVPLVVSTPNSEEDNTVAVEAKYTAPLQVVETEEMRDRIRAIADGEKISQAQVIREILAAGIVVREQESHERLGEL